MSTSTGVTLHYAMFGREATLPVDWVFPTLSAEKITMYQWTGDMLEERQLGFPLEFQFWFPSGNLPEFFSISIMEKVPEDPEFRSGFRIFLERNSEMCSGKFPEQRSGNRKFSGTRSGNREIFRKQHHVHRHLNCTSV